MQKQNSQTVKYPLATAGKRIMAKVLDVAIISCVVIALGFTIFCTDPNFVWNQPLVLSQNWRYGLFVTIMSVVFFSLMLLLPRLWGKTIGMKALKLQYFKKEDCNYTFGIFKHELFVWEIVVFIALIMGWIVTFMSQHQIDSFFEGVNSIFANSVPEGLDKVCYYVGTGFSCLYGVAIIFLVAIVIAICIKSGRPAFHDKFSNVYVFYKQKAQDQYQSVNSYKKQHKEDNAPGAISSESLEEISNL